MADTLRSLFLLDPEVTFLNHGSFGACPRPVFEACQAWQRQLERQPVAFLDPMRGLSGWLREVRVAMAAEIGADPDDIVGLTNATEALNIVAQSLALAPGDEILTTDHEYAALDKTWAYVARRTGAKVIPVTIPLPLTDAQAFAGALRAAITPRTRVLFLSHITSDTALVFPIAGVFGNTPFIDGFEMKGTRDHAAWLSVPAAIAFRRQHDWDRIAARCRDLVQETARRVAALTGLAPLSGPAFCAPQMVAMPVPRCDPMALKLALLEGHGIEIPCFDWKDQTIVRLSVQGYNTAAEMDHLVTALAKILPSLHRSVA